MMDVLRHYGAGNLSAFLGPSCADEQMDHDSLLLGGYTTAQKQAQLDALPTQYGAARPGAARTSPRRTSTASTRTSRRRRPTRRCCPADYAAAVGPPQPWSPTDIIDIATLVGGIFGKGGGNETANAKLLRYLQAQVGSARRRRRSSPTSSCRTTPTPRPPRARRSRTSRPARWTPAKVALVDTNQLGGGPTDTTANCSLTAPSLPALRILESLTALPQEMSNALLVDGAHSADGHPIAVMGPQVGYYTPQILMEEDLHAPDFDAEGTAFPGTNFVVELGRGRNFAWSATSANTDNVDQVAEKICDPNGGTPAAQGTSYLYNGVCTPMDHQNVHRDRVHQAGWAGRAGRRSRHDVYYTVHGVVQGWTTVDGAPVAIVNDRSTYHHEVDSGVGFLRWNRPSLHVRPGVVHAGRGQHPVHVQLVLHRHQHHRVLPVRPRPDPRHRASTPTCRAWGTGNAEWQGYLSFDGHPTRPARRRATSSAGTTSPRRGSRRPTTTTRTAGAAHALAAARRDRRSSPRTASCSPAPTWSARWRRPRRSTSSGPPCCPSCSPRCRAAAQPAGVQAMLATLQAWLSHGALRRKASPATRSTPTRPRSRSWTSSTRRSWRRFFDHLFKAGGVATQLGLPASYDVVPEPFSQNPNQTGGGGSSYYGGLQSQVVKVLRQLNGEAVGAAVQRHDARRSCAAAAGWRRAPRLLNTALLDTYNAMSASNGGSTTPSTWTANAETQAGGAAHAPARRHLLRRRRRRNASPTSTGRTARPSSRWWSSPGRPRSRRAGGADAAAPPAAVAGLVRSAGAPAPRRARPTAVRLAA